MDAKNLPPQQEARRSLHRTRAGFVSLKRWEVPVARMNHPTALERAFQLASTGNFRTVEEVRRILSQEGYSISQIDGPTLSKQLRDAIKKARQPSVEPSDPARLPK